MRFLLVLLLLIQAPLAPLAAAQPAQPLLWQPAADYVTIGQDEPGYRRWVAMRPWRAGFVSSFHQYLDDAGVAYVVPTWQLLRTASQWGRCGAEPFEMPPMAEWPNIVQTLRFVRDYVVPAIGPVEAVSAYRNPLLNQCAGGARESVHQHMSAVDLVPVRPISRPEMIARLCAAHALQGNRYAVGLGFYTKFRFHVDSWKYRTWGQNDAGKLACASPIHTPAVPPSSIAAVTVTPVTIDPLAPK